MDAPSAGQEARSAVIDRPAPAATAADSKPADDSLPLSPDDFGSEASEPEVDGRKKAREILRGMVKEGQGAKADDDEPAGDDAADKAGAEDKAGETKTAAADAEKPASEKPGDKGAGDAALSDARDALIRDGWTSADLDKLPPERIAALGERARSRQKQQDGFGRQKSEEIASLKAKLAELEGTAQKPADQPQAGQQQQSSAATTADPFADPDLKDVATELDKLGDVASPEVKNVVKSSLAKMFGLLEKRMSDRVGTVTQAAEQQMIAAARVKVAEEFPAIKDEAKFKAVHSKMQVLAKTGAYGPGDMDTLMKDACKLTLPAASITDVQRKMLEASQKAQNGQVDAGQRSRTAADSKPASEVDRNRQILRMMKKGKSAEEARRAAMAR